MRDFMNRIRGLWCETMHDRVLWPIHGKYRCATCQREYAVEFEELRAGGEARPASLAFARHGA